MKKIFIIALCAVILGILVNGTYSFLETKISNSSRLLMKNVEALSFGESSIDMSDCDGGPANYNVVGAAIEYLESRVHSPDSLDYLTTYEAEVCYAYGYGNLRGFNGMLDIYIDNEIRVKCNGIHYDYQLP